MRERESLEADALAIEKALGVAIEPIVTDVNSMTEVDDDGNLTFESAQRFRDYLPDVFVPFGPVSFAGLFSVAMIEAMCAKAVEDKTTRACAAASLSKEQTVTLRGMIARRARVPVDQVTPETNFFRDLKMDGTSLGMLLGLIKGEFDVDVFPLVSKIESRWKVDSGGHVTPESRKQLESVLPGFPYETVSGASFTDLLSVGVIESLVAKLLAQRPADLPFEPITSFKYQEWIWKLPEELGDRKLRLLLAAACRLAFRDKPTEASLAIETLERFADTGKTKGALREFQKAHTDWHDPRNQSEYVGLYHALTLDDPELAIIPVTGAIQSGLRMNSLEALRELQRLHRDLISPLTASDEFLAGWRTSAITDLAKSMYDSRNFSEMQRLAELLEHDGCRHPAVLEHCRDPKLKHVRGCWVIDAILDGSWVTEPKVAKAKAAKSKNSTAAGSSGSKKSLLSQFPKRAQIDITKTMAEEHSQVPVETYLVKYFYAGRQELIQAFAAFDPQNAESELDNQLFELETKRPELTADQRLSVLSCRHLNLHSDVAVARRITLEDPAELARGLYVSNRLDWLNSGCQAQGSDFLLQLFAVRDLALVQHLAEHTSFSNTQSPNDEEVLCSYAMDALIKRDFKSLETVATRMKRKKVRSWMEHKFACLLGIADRNPDQIAEGLRGILESYQKRRDEDSHSTYTVFNVEAHGLYRLSEWISPDLVAGFDVTQSFPWDGEFHSWTQSHELPLEGLDFIAVAPLLRDAILEFKIPEWWIQTPEAAKQREQELISKCDLWLLDFGENPGPVQDYVKNFSGKAVATCPTEIMSAIMRYIVEGQKRKLESLGATLEIRQ